MPILYKRVDEAHFQAIPMLCTSRAWQLGGEAEARQNKVGERRTSSTGRSIALKLEATNVETATSVHLSRSLAHSLTHSLTSTAGFELLIFAPSSQIPAGHLSLAPFAFVSSCFSVRRAREAGRPQRALREAEGGRCARVAPLSRLPQSAHLESSGALAHSTTTPPTIAARVMWWTLGAASKPTTRPK